MHSALPEVQFGTVEEDDERDRHLVPDDEPEDDEDAPASDDLIEILGFDPDEDSGPAEDRKFEKADVDYEHPAKGADHCGECAHFKAPDACELVDGAIAAEDWCELFDAR